MKLTVLGRHGPFPAPGGACSGYLVQAGDTSLVLDLGSGALSNLRRIKPNLDVDAVLLSHLHSDHMADMLILRYAIPQLIRGCGADIKTPMTVAAPETPELEYRQLASSGVFEMIPAKPGTRMRFGDVAVTLYASAHTVETCAFRVEFGGKCLFYTGDTGMHGGIAEQCAGADLLLADACFLQEEKPGEHAQHLTAAEAGRLAARAGVGQLICTHMWGGEDRSEKTLRQARQYFPNSLIAEEMHEYYV